MRADGAAGVSAERELIAFADAAVGRRADLAARRDAVRAVLGEEATLDAAAVIAGFDAITRVADATGIPLEAPKAEATADWRAALGINSFRSAKV